MKTEDQPKAPICKCGTTMLRTRRESLKIPSQWVCVMQISDLVRLGADAAKQNHSEPIVIK